MRCIACDMAERFTFSSLVLLGLFVNIQRKLGRTRLVLLLNFADEFSYQPTHKRGCPFRIPHIAFSSSRIEKRHNLVRVEQRYIC